MIPKKKTTILQTDASIKGLGAVLLQDGHPVYFASKALTQVERGYVAIKLEALAASWSMEKFHHFLFASQGKSPFNALHIYRNTPLAKNKLSPMQILSGRCPQNDLPRSDSASLQYGRPISVPTEILRDPKKESQANSHNFHWHRHVMFLQPDQKKLYPARVVNYSKQKRQMLKVTYHLCQHYRKVDQKGTLNHQLDWICE